MGNNYNKMDPKTFYKILFNKIFDNFLTNLETQFGSLNKLNLNK